MSAVEEKLRATIVDHEVLESAGLVTYVVDVWRGDKDDPAVAVTRYLGVWDADDLVGEDDEALTPTISLRNPGGYSESLTQKPQAKIWEQLKTVKAADQDARQFKSHDEHMMSDSGYMYGERRLEREKYQNFMRALDVLSVDETNEEAWALVDEWRKYQALKYEK